MITKEQFSDQIALILKKYNDSYWFEKIESVLEALESEFDVDEFWLSEWLFCKSQDRPFVYVEEYSAGNYRIFGISEANELYDFLIRIVEEHKRNQHVYRYCI